MEAALEIVNQTFVSIFCGNFICIRTDVFVHVGLALAAERPLCPFAHLTVAFRSDKKTRLSTRLLLIKTEGRFGCSLLET